MDKPLIIVPAQPTAQLFRGFDPLNLPELIAYVQSLSVASDGLVNTTINQLRQLETPSTLRRYYTLDAGREGAWRYDPADTTSADDTGLTLVSAGGKRYKREIDEYVRLSWFIGNVQNTDISLLIKNITFLLAAKNLTSRYVRLEPGSYRWDNYIILNPYGVDMRCYGGLARLYTSTLESMLWVTRDSRFENIQFNGASGAAATTQEEKVRMSLVTNSAVSDFINCWFEGSRGNGVSNDGNIQLRNDTFPTGSNSSRSTFIECHFRLNKGDGWYAEGFDANIILVYHYNSTDNGGYGMRDSSFLGCMLEGAGHCNNNTLGGHRVDNANNRSLVVAPYEEDGQPGSYFEGRYTLIAPRLSGANTIRLGALGKVYGPGY